MKRRQRRPVLELNQSQYNSHGEHLQNKRKHINSDNIGQNAPANPLANLLCHYNSDSDTEESKKNCKLDDQVNNFFKEIQLIAPKQPISNEPSNSSLNVNSNTRLPHQVHQQALMWRECLDESSGYPYYWHIETNEVTWEIPDELRYLKNSMKANSIMKSQLMQESHWVDFSSVTLFSDQQSHENIPEGMIPREVVARNRNRYTCNDNIQKQDSQTDQDIANTSDTMDNDSDDGKIEMITSYGSDETDSDAGDEKESKKATCFARAPKNRRSISKSRNPPRLSSPASIIQLQIPTVSQNPNHNFENKDTVGNNTTESLDSKSVENTETKYLKSQVEHQNIVQEIGECSEKINNDNRMPKGSTKKRINSKRNIDPDVDFRISLVPGYDEDSDAEEETEIEEDRKALFPIPQTDESTDTILSSHKMILDENRTTDSNDSDTNGDNKKIEEQNNGDAYDRLENREELNTKLEEDVQKGNRFLDNLHGRNKLFQRKKRIAFDVPTTKTKATEDTELNNKSDVELQREETNSCDGYTDELQIDQNEKSNPANENADENTHNYNGASNNTEEVRSTLESQTDTKEEEAEVNLLSQLILEKLKFLSEGKTDVSPVQMMSIQLQTLCVAWEAGCLEKSYLRRWLTDTSHELERLEQDAAPPGWLCQWDRSHKRYYYQNTTNGITQWTYPDTGIAGGAEEMEICSTPPPTEQDEIVIAVAEEDGLKTKTKKQEESGEVSTDMIIPRNNDVEAPPPPQISNPSPPPPPRIHADDLKKDKRKQDKENEKLDNTKPHGENGLIVVEVKPLGNPVAAIHSSALLSPQPSTLTSATSAEPLPPGVDLTEAPYEIPTTALKRMIYSAVQSQGNALYEASTRDPTVPILSHPATIVQEHYLQYPAYHQHLHAPTALVLPHKHSVQPAIQLIPDYTPIYTNHKVIEKPPVKTAKESLVSALDSFYSDIARIENIGTEKVPQRQDTTIVEPLSLPVEEIKVETEQEQLVPVETAMKEKKRKRTRIGISKKHKEVSSMVAKWQKVQQNFENT